MSAILALALALGDPPKAPSTPEERADAFIQRALDAHFDEVRDKYESDLREKRTKLATYKLAVFSPKKPGKPESWIDPDTKDRLFKGGPDAKQKEIAYLEDQIAYLERQCEPSLKYILDYRPKLKPGRLAIGDFGAFPEQIVFKLTSEEIPMDVTLVAEQIADEQNMRVRVDAPLSEAEFWLSGFSTTGLVDGQTFKTDKLFIVSGTKQYPTALGSVRTILHVELFDLDKLLVIERAKERIAAMKK